MFYNGSLLYGNVITDMSEITDSKVAYIHRQHLLEKANSSAPGFIDPVLGKDKIVPPTIEKGGSLRSYIDNSPKPVDYDLEYDEAPVTAYKEAQKEALAAKKEQAIAESMSYTNEIDEAEALNRRTYGNRGRVAYSGIATTEKIGNTEKSINNITAKLQNGAKTVSHSVIDPAKGTYTGGSNYSWDILDSNEQIVAPRISANTDSKFKLEDNKVVEGNIHGGEMIGRNITTERAGRNVYELAADADTLRKGRNVPKINSNKSFSLGKLGKMALGGAVLGGVLMTMMSNGGHQTNEQLYGQQPVNR